MAEAISIQQLKDASLDVKSIEEVVNGDENVVVTTRLGETYPSIKGSIKKLFENGGLPATPFATKALMTASALVDGQYAMVTNDTVNNGLYVKTAGAWVKSGYDPVLSANTTMQNTLRYGVSPETVGAINAVGVSPQVTYYNGSSNIWVEKDKYINSTGQYVAHTPLILSDYLAVGKGDQITIETVSQATLSTFDKDRKFIAVYGGAEGTQLIHTVSNPLVKFVRVCLSSAEEGNKNFSITKGFKELPWLKTTTSNIYDSVRSIFDGAEVLGDNILEGVTFTDGFYLDNTGEPVAFATYKYSDFVPVTAGTSYIISLASTYVGTWYDVNKNLLASIPAGTDVGIVDHKVTAPTGAAFVRVNISNSDPKKSMLEVTNKLTIPPSQGGSATPLSNWVGKKIAWYGTSIPAGYPKHTSVALQDVWSHANLAVHDLGASIINKSVPAGGVKSTLQPHLSFTNLAGATNYQNALIDLFGTANNPDLVVFDYGVNDYPTSNDAHLLAFDPKDPYDLLGTGKSKISDTDETTFIGAYNTVVTAMLTAKPSQRFCFITHFSDDYTRGMNFFKLLNETIEALALHWQAPVLRLHRKTNYRTRHGFDSINLSMPDNIHPASGDGSSVQSLRAIMRDFLISIG